MVKPPSTPVPPSSLWEDELSAIRLIHAQLEKLTPVERVRVLQYVMNRLEIHLPSSSY